MSRCNCPAAGAPSHDCATCGAEGTFTRAAARKAPGPYIPAGTGFDVGANFARARTDTPITLEPREYAKPGYVIGYIAGDKASALGFMRADRVRVHVQVRLLAGLP